MDPTANLQRQRELVQLITDCRECESFREFDEAVAEYAHELAQLVAALDTHLTDNGFLPTDWASGDNPPRM